jgi:hypothetical protein
MRAQRNEQHDPKRRARKQAPYAAPHANSPLRAAFSHQYRSSCWLLVDKVFLRPRRTGSKAILGDNLNVTGPYASAQ